ncbi:MAG: M20/M25/M40 family metallo-hydrolase [Planctomycetota bacterium]
MLVAVVTVLAACLSRVEPPAAPVATPVSPQGAVSQDRLMATLRAIPTKRAALGDKEHRQGLLQTEQWIQDQLKDAGLTAVPHEFAWTTSMLEMAIRSETGSATKPPAGETPQPQRLWRNYTVDLAGTDLPREVFILSCHYDAVPNSPGADDNGTGVAAAIELARSLKDFKTRRTIRLAFFTLEEVGLIGSIEYVKSRRDLWKSVNPKVDPAKEETIIGMASMEMLGFYTDKPDSQKSPIPKVGDFTPPTVGDFIAMAGISKFRAFSQRLTAELKAAEPELKVFTLDFLPFAPPDLLRSDHAPFLAAGVPAVILSDTANFRNANYHRPTDTSETIDATRFTRTVRGLAGAAYVLAEPVAVPSATPPSPGK